MKPRTRYGILDDFGDIIRWSWSRPPANCKFITERIKVRPVIDWDNFEPALC